MWKTVKLDDIFNFKNGRSFKKTEWKENGLPIIRIQNLNNANASFNYFEGEYDSSIEVNNGDLLFSWSGTVGTSFGAHIWERDKGVLNQHIFKLTKKSEIDTRYAFYCLKHITKLIEQSVVGAVGIRHVTKKNLVEFEIPLPSLAEQERIVAKLDAAFAEIDEAIEAADAAAMNLSSLRSILYEQIIIQNCSTYTEYTLKEIVSENCSLSYGIVQPGEDVPNGLPIVRPVDMHKKFINTKLLKRINPLIADGYKRTILEGNELLMSVRGTTGIISVTSDVLEGANVTRGIIPIRFNSQLVERDFGYYAMLSHKVQKQISDATYGAALQQINVKDVKQIKIAIPAISEQKNIIDILNKIDKSLLLLERCSSQKMANITSLKSAILAQELQSEAA